MSAPTTPRSVCRLQWCTSSHDSQTHPITNEPGTTLSHQDFRVAQHRYKIQQAMLEAYEKEGLKGPSFCFYQDYYRTRGWSLPIPKDNSIAETPPSND